MYNKKVLIDSLKKLGSAKAPTKKPDIIYEPKGQLKYPGQNTRIPSGDITMQGVPYPVLGKPNVGQPQMMQPGQNYQFPGADYVDEYPQMKKGGRTKGLVSMPKPSKKGLMSKKYSRSLDATNKFFTQNYLFAKPKSRKNKVFDPNSKYYAKGGQSNETHITSKDGVETPIYKKVDIKPSKIHGNGLFTKEAIKKNEPVGICHVKNKDGQLIPSTILGMYNHNKKTPNVYEINKGDHVVMMPLRDINPGEELTADYDMVPIEGLQDSSSFQDDEKLNFSKKKKGGALLTKKVTCKKCGWKWDAADGGNDITTCHECGGQGLVHAQDGINTDAMNGMMKARLAYANEFGNPAAERMINLPDNPYQFDNGDTGTHYMASYDNYAVPQIQDENGVLQLGDYGPESNEAIRFDSDEDANYFAENYKDVSPGFINEKQYGGLHKFIEGGAEVSGPPKGWPPIGNYKGLLGLVKKIPTVNTFGNALKLPAVNWTTPSIPTLKREFNVEQVLKNQNFFPDENSFLNAVKNATVQEITPEIDATIGYRSGTTTKEDLIELSKTYGSWPEYRNEATINSIFDGLKSGTEMEMPMVLQFPNGNKRVFSGNTRMDASRQLGINPNVLMLNVPDMTKLANPWKREVFPGLQYKSTMLNNPKGLWTQVAKDGTINVENALKFIEKESAGDVKVELLKETLGENIPKKMDFNLFRKKTQETIIPLETTIVDHSSNYGIRNVGYPGASRNSFERALEFNNLEIAEIEKAITENPKITERDLYILKNDQEALLKSKNQLLKSQDDFSRLPLENKTVIFSNKDLFGVGSDAHSNPPETLGHIHFLRDAEFPDILLATQIQSDPFQSKNYWKYNINNETDALGSEIRRIASKIESSNDYIAQGIENYNYSKEQWEEKKLSTLEEINELNNDINVLKEKLEPIVKKYTPNYKQKVLLDKNHKKRFFQEFLNYAANRGDVNYIAIPTVETSARIQNYQPLAPTDQPGPESKLLMDNSNSLEEFVKKSEEMYGDSFQDITEQEKHILIKGYELYKKNGTLKGLLNDKRNYKSKHGTVLGNYEEYIKIAKKLGLEIEDIIIKGHTYKKIVIPEDFLKGVGEIDAYRKGGATNKSIEINLTPEEIKKYVNGGYVVEELDNFRDGGTTDPPPPWNPDYPINFYEFESLSPEEKAFRDNQSGVEKLSKEELAKYNYEQALINEPKYADEGLEFVKGWHDSPMYNQMVLNSYNGQQKNADYLTKLRKQNIAAIPRINITDKNDPDDESIQGESNSSTGEVTVFPTGFEYGPGLYTHEFTHSSDRPRELYKWDHPSYLFQSSENPLHYEFKNPSWMYYEDPRFPNDPSVNHGRVIPKSDQMYISTHRGANWKDNENYKIYNSAGAYTARTDDQIKKDMITNGLSPDESDFNYIFEGIKKQEKIDIKKYIKDDKQSWQEYGHEYVSSPTEVRARLATIRMNAKKKGIYDPYTEQITPEIFENYINKQLDDEDYNALQPIDDLRREFTDEEILHMLRTISQNKNDSKTENEFDMQYSQYGGVADYQLGDEVDEDTMKTLKKLGYTFNKI